MQKVHAGGSRLTPFIVLFAMSRLVKQNLTIVAPAKLVKQSRDAIPPGFDLTVTLDETLPDDRVQLVNVFGEVEVEIEGIWPHA